MTLCTVWDGVGYPDPAPGSADATGPKKASLSGKSKISAEFPSSGLPDRSYRQAVYSRSRRKLAASSENRKRVSSPVRKRFHLDEVLDNGEGDFRRVGQIGRVFSGISASSQLSCHGWRINDGNVDSRALRLPRGHQRPGGPPWSQRMRRDRPRRYSDRKRNGPCLRSSQAMVRTLRSRPERNPHLFATDSRDRPVECPAPE